MVYNRYEADRKYDEANAKRYGLKLIKKNDQDIIDEIEKHESFQGYVKRLIREDIAKRKENDGGKNDE